jgi:nucleotide-binding universal stress UspA family protein
MFHDILVAVDGSAHARAAVREAADIAQAQKARLTLIGAYSSLLPWPAMLPVGLTQETIDQVVDAARSIARAALDEAAALVPDGVEARTLCVDERPADAILAELDGGGHDLVVVGSRGRGDVASLVLGSVSHRIVHESRVPVLVVHVLDGKRPN